MSENEPGTTAAAKIPGTQAEPSSTRWALVRDLLAFQFKLAMDGLRDILLSPVSLLAALAGIFSNSRDPARYFNRLLEFGHRTDRWINLFNTWDNTTDQSPSADSFVRHAESFVLHEYEKGGVVHDLKTRTDVMTDRVIDRIQAKRKRARADKPPPDSV